MVVPWWNLSREFHALGKLEIALLERTLEINVLDRFAQISGGVDDGDQAVFDGVVDHCAFFDCVGEDAGGGDVEGFAAGRGGLLVWSGWEGYRCCSDFWGNGFCLRFWWVWGEVHALQGEDVVFGVFAELERVVAWDGEIAIEGGEGEGAGGDAGGEHGGSGEG